MLTDRLYDHPHSVDREEEPEVDVLAEEDFLQRVQWVHPGRVNGDWGDEAIIQCLSDIVPQSGKDMSVTVSNCQIVR